MHAIIAALRQHLRIARAYPAAMLLVLGSFVLVIYYGHVEHRMAHAAGYLVAVWLGAFVTDIVVELNPRQAIGFPIRHPPWKEVAVILACVSLALVFLAIRFSSVWKELHGLSRLAVIPLIVFVYPIALVLLYLLVFRYRPSQLGINFHYWYLPLFIHLIVGGITLAVAPDKSHWHAAVREYGVVNLLFTGIVCAALSEEFLRMLLQTRLGAALRSKGVGFVLATFIWAAMHLPVTAQGSWPEFRHLLFGGMWTIMPIGFLWGYMTHRTKSLLPAVLVHGLNLWGLQNLG